MDDSQQAPTRQWAEARTPNASRYLQQLCKHFAHKVEVEYNAETGRATLPGGRVEMRAGAEALVLMVEGARPVDLVKVRFVVEEHLLRFAFRENMGLLDWRAGPPEE